MKFIIEPEDIHPGQMYSLPDRDVIMVLIITSGVFALGNFTKAQMLLVNLNAAQVAEKLNNWSAKPLWLENAVKAEHEKRQDTEAIAAA